MFLKEICFYMVNIYNYFNLIKGIVWFEGVSLYIDWIKLVRFIVLCLWGIVRVRNYECLLLRFLGLFGFCFFWYSEV